ncbi:hypothetical protein N0V82_004352 [Gnomoniopsis sp. IMI 355080]|nr:hypothetical protein N0V82_004352 [Gnomoniopsis sp. IMI 355080]
MAIQREPVVLPALEPSPDAFKRSTVIFLHGLGDDGRGTGYGLAQQFQIYQKLPHTKWVLPTANIDPAVGQRCWYKPHDLPSPMKPRVPARDDDEEEEDAVEAEEGEDEEGILRTVEYIDSLVAAEVEAGIDPKRIVVGGFSQGCAVSMIWGLKGAWRDRVGGVFGLSGYFPKIKAVMPSNLGTDAEEGKHASRWFFGHGMVDQLISTTLFADGQKRLQQFVSRDNVEGHVYADLGHDVGGGELRDFWLWLKTIFQE